MHYAVTACKKQYFTHNAFLEGELRPVGTLLDQIDHHARGRSLDVIAPDTGKGVHSVIINEYAGTFRIGARVLPAFRSLDRVGNSILPF